MKGYIFFDESSYFDHNLDYNHFIIGDLIKIAAKPPFLVVNSDIEKMLVIRWPGSLWYVEVLTIGDMSNLRKDAGYVRATEIKLLKKMPSGILFGKYGDKICAILNAANSITLSEAEQLAEVQKKYPKAASYYSKAWDNWLGFDLRTHIEDNFEGHGYNSIEIKDNSTTISVFDESKASSPINHGFSLISQIINNRARKISGEAAFKNLWDDEQEDYEIVLGYPWSEACHSFIYAAMAEGAPELLDKEQRKILLEPYNTIYGK